MDIIIHKFKLLFKAKKTVKILMQISYLVQTMYNVDSDVVYSYVQWCRALCTLKGKRLKPWFYYLYIFGLIEMKLIL